MVVVGSSDASGRGSNKVLDAIGAEVGCMGVWPDSGGHALSATVYNMLVVISGSGCRLS